MTFRLKTSEDTKAGTRKRPAARWKRDPWSDDLQARRVAARTSQDIQILLEDFPGEPVQVLTLTLPGAWHGIRRASIFAQWEYMRARRQVRGLPGVWSMRGLNKMLTDAGAVGGWHFFEVAYSKKNKWWHLHCHTILVGDISSVIPRSAYTVDENWTKKLESSTSGTLRELGFGERYTLDEAVDYQETISYCSKLAYCTKQKLDGPEQQLVAFLRARKPRLSEAWGAARVGDDRRVEFALEHDDHDSARYLLDRQERRREYKLRKALEAHGEEAEEGRTMSS